MNFDYLFRASQDWEQAIEKGLGRSSAAMMAVIFLALNVIGLVNDFRSYGTLTPKQAITVDIFLLLFAAMVALSSYYVVRICRDIQQRVRSGFLDAESRQTLLNVSYMGFRLYLILLCTSSLIFIGLDALRG
jgi:hypothetical protein